MSDEIKTDGRIYANAEKAPQNGTQSENEGYRKAVSVVYAESMSFKELRARLNALGVDVDSERACTVLKYPKAYSKRVYSLFSAVHRHLAELTGGRATNGNVRTEWYTAEKTDTNKTSVGSEAADMKIVCDNREQAAFSFASYPEVETVQGTLTTGDYAPLGLESVCAVERKSLADLVGCLGRDRERFERELERAAALQSFAVVVEAGFLELAHGEYRGKLNPHAALQSVLAFSARLRIPFIFAGNRGGAEYACYHFLRQFVQGERKRLKAVEQAIGAA